MPNEKNEPKDFKRIIQQKHREYADGKQRKCGRVTTFLPVARPSVF